jgi:tRNA-intron endonuclease, archaea type
MSKIKSQQNSSSKSTEPVKATLMDSKVLTENSDHAKDLYETSRYGTLLNDGRINLSFIESLYLIEKGRLTILNQKNTKIDFDKFFKKVKKQEPNLWTRYVVYKDMRNRGYIVKTALKFGADFRVYDRGVKPGEDHAKWIIFPVKEGNTLTWHDFSAKNRVAHSTRKRLLIGIVDDEGDVTYYEIKWTRP